MENVKTESAGGETMESLENRPDGELSGEDAEGSAGADAEMADQSGKDAWSPRLEKKELPRKKEDEISELKEVIANLTEELKKREAELVGARDQSLRAVAEADNYKKRLAREKEEFEKYAAVPFVRAILPALDNLENALNVSRDTGASKLSEGVELVHRQMLDALKSFGLARLEVAGKPLDPALCEVIQMVEDPDREEGIVATEYIPGYMFKDRVIRTAKVVVTKKPEELPQDSSAD